MSGSIKISPKHGLNPSIPVCLFCGKQKNEIILAGRINKNDDEMPRECVTDAEPCDECRNMWSQGVALLRASEKNNGNMVPVKSGDSVKYLNGAFMVMKEEAANRVFNMELKKGQVVLLEDTGFDQLDAQVKEAESKE